MHMQILRKDTNCPSVDLSMSMKFVVCNTHIIGLYKIRSVAVAKKADRTA